MAKVKCDAFVSGVLLTFFVFVAETVGFAEFPASFTVLALVVVHNTHFVENLGISLVKFVRLLKL